MQVAANPKDVGSHGLISEVEMAIVMYSFGHSCVEGRNVLAKELIKTMPPSLT
jgi:hypothetical protein